MANPSKAALLGLSIALLLTACGKEPALPEKPASMEIRPSSTALEGNLSIIAWPGYIERGETDPKYDWVSDFEIATGCKVSVKSAGNSDEMVALMNQGGYDLVTASGDASLRLIDIGRVQAIDINRIKSYSSVDRRLQDAPWHTVGGRHYGVPYQWGPNVLMYNTDVFKTPPDSWSVVFEQQKLPDGKSNKRRVQAFDSPIYIADAALYLKTKHPELGITDPYALDERQYAAAIDLLENQSILVHRYWHEATVQLSDFKTEGVVASGSWPFQVNALLKDGQPIASTIPAEEATGWADSTMLHIEARNPNCAYAWMEWSLSPKVQGDVASFFGSLPAVPEACHNNAHLGPDGCRTNGMDNFEKIHFWRTPEAKCANASGCVPYSRWTEDYIAIMGG